MYAKRTEQTHDQGGSFNDFMFIRYALGIFHMQNIVTDLDNVSADHDTARIVTSHYRPFQLTADASLETLTP